MVDFVGMAEASPCGRETLSELCNAMCCSKCHATLWNSTAHFSLCALVKQKHGKFIFMAALMHRAVQSARQKHRNKHVKQAQNNTGHWQTNLEKQSERFNSELKSYTIVLEPHSKLQLHNKKQGTPMKALHDSHLKCHQATSLRMPQCFFLRKTSVIRLLLHRRSDVHVQREDVSSAAASNQVMFSFGSRVLCHLMIITGGLCCSCGHMICCYWLTQRSG